MNSQKWDDGKYHTVPGVQIAHQCTSEARGHREKQGKIAFEGPVKDQEPRRYDNQAKCAKGSLDAEHYGKIELSAIDKQLKELAEQTGGKFIDLPAGRLKRWYREYLDQKEDLSEQRD